MCNDCCIPLSEYFTHNGHLTFENYCVARQYHDTDSKYVVLIVSWEMSNRMYWTKRDETIRRQEEDA